jgi:hypothetical protein
MAQTSVLTNLLLLQRLFKAASVLNVIAAASALAAMALHFEMFYAERSEPSLLLTFYHYNFWFVVFIMGVSYWYLAAEPVRNRVVALLGGLGKLTVAVWWAALFLTNHATAMVLMGVLYDGSFGVLMLWFFWRTRNA